MTKFKSINPANNQLVKKFKEHTPKQIAHILEQAMWGFTLNRTSSFMVRSRRLRKLAKLLLQKKEKFAALMTLEMGKPTKEALGEVEKCAWVCNYYADNAKQFLKDEFIKTEHAFSVITHSPLGIILAIMPWNFPFWQFFRFAAPALMAGNVILLKHAPNVPQCALAIENLCKEAGFPDELVQNLFINHKKTAKIIADNRIQAITFTGSDRAGSQVAALAGKHIKKTVLELGGSDPFIVLADANIKKAAQIAVKSRMLNTGQSCIAAKRWIVVASVLAIFTKLVRAEILQLEMGNPVEEGVTIGPLAREDLVKTLDEQVKKSVKLGAKVLIGGKRPAHDGAYYEPTLLTNVKKGMPAYDEEIFGPVAVIIAVADEQEAIEVANDTKYGLGASIWTIDKQKASRLARKLQTGAVFINGMVKSDPRLPFGGIKKSGYGRELSEQGIKEFVNVKTIVVE